LLGAESRSVSLDFRLARSLGLGHVVRGRVIMFDESVGRSGRSIAWLGILAS
jgi:hypothetical protein